MERIETTIASETRRMELRGIVRLAGEVIARYWPMRNFVHHNPLHSLEYLPFDETVRRGRKFLGGQGYLSDETYRGYLRAGRIRLRSAHSGNRAGCQAERNHKPGKRKCRTVLQNENVLPI